MIYSLFMLQKNYLPPSYFCTVKKSSGIVPFVTTPLKGRFVVDYLLCLAPAGGSKPAGPIALPCVAIT